MNRPDFPLLVPGTLFSVSSCRLRCKIHQDQRPLFSFPRKRVKGGGRMNKNKRASLIFALSSLHTSNTHHHIQCERKDSPVTSQVLCFVVSEHYGEQMKSDEIACRTSNPSDLIDAQVSMCCMGFESQEAQILDSMQSNSKSIVRCVKSKMNVHVNRRMYVCL